MATQLLFAPLMAFKNGVFSPGATVEFYLSGTTTPVVVTDADGLTIAQPVEADAAGVFPEIYRAGGAALKAVIKDSDGATIATIDPIAQVNSLGSAADNVSFTPVTGNTATDVQTAIENNTANSVKDNEAETVTADWTFSGTLTMGSPPWLSTANAGIFFNETDQSSGGMDRVTTIGVVNGNPSFIKRNDDGSGFALFGQLDRNGGLSANESLVRRDAGDARYAQQSNLDLTMTDVTGSRAHSTSYQNTSGQTQVVQTYTSGAGAVRIQTSPDNSTWTDVGSATSGGFFWNNMFHVPNGSYWRINGSVTIGKVYEGTVVGA